MKHISRLFWMIVWTAVLAGCIKVELKDERTIPKLYEVALVTYTPEGWSPAQPTATKLPASPTLVPSPTATRTITPSATLPPPPSATPTSHTPMITGTILTNVWCKQGPGFIYPGMRLLVTEEGFILLGRNSDASWWWIQPSLGDITCWVPTMVINLPQPLPGVPVLTAQATPQSQPLHSTPVPTKKPRVRSPQSTTGPTDTPNPYPNPYPYPAP